LTKHELTYEICYVRAPVSPPLKEQGGCASVMHPRSGVPGPERLFQGQKKAKLFCGIGIPLSQRNI